MNDLFAEFPNSTKDAWKIQAIKDLRGKDFSAALSSQLWGKIPQEPLYALEDFSTSLPTQIAPHPPHEFSGVAPRIWSNLVSVFPGDSNESILHQLESGAEGLVLHLTGFEELDSMLKNVHPEFIPLLIQPLGNPILILQKFSDWAAKQVSDPSLISGALLWSPSDMVFDHNLEFGLALEIAQELFEIAEPLTNFKVFSLNTSRYTESGSNPLDAVIFSMGELIDWMDQGGLPPKKVFQKVILQGGVGDHHFGEIARLKAFRKAVTELASLYEVQVNPNELQLLFQSPYWTKSKLDANTNLIRQTYEAMAGVLGGANMLWIRAFQEENASELERRMAKNVSLILKEEAFLDQVLDPAAGAFYLEKIEEQILEEIRDGLEKLESKGGFSTYLEGGKIHFEVRKHRQQVQQAVLDKTLKKVGANVYQGSELELTTEEFDFFEEKSYELNSTRATYLTELQTLNHL